MATIFLTITQAVQAALAGLPGVQGVHLDLDHALAPDAQPAVAIEPGDDDTQDYGDGSELQGNFDLRVHVLTAGTPTVTQADPIEAAVHQRLMADRSLGGITWLTRTGGTRRLRGEGGQVGQRTITYRAVLQVGTTTLQPVNAT